VTPHTCPVCHGTGVVAGTNSGFSTAQPLPLVCHACQGTGIVWEAGAVLTTDDLGRLRALAIQMKNSGRLIQVSPEVVLELVVAEEGRRKGATVEYRDGTAEDT